MGESRENVDPILPESIGGYVFKGGIGHGAFSVVKVVYSKELNQYFACKIISKDRLSTPKRRERFENEIRIQQQLNHPGIVKIYDLLSDSENYYIILEFCSGGELFQLIVDKKRLLEVQAKPIIYQILDALDYIHKLGVCHRDIKPENILIDQTGRVKLSDFGLSKFISQESSLVSTPCGSPCYASPECLSGKEYDGVASDMWSLGVLLYATVIGQLPWTKRNQSELFRQIKAADFTIPNFITNDCRDLIYKLMTPDSTKRLTARQAMKHSWFNTMQNVNFVSIPSKKEDLSIKKVDQFFQKYDESYQKIDKIAFTISDSTFSTVPKTLHKLSLPIRSQNIDDNTKTEKTCIENQDFNQQENEFNDNFSHNTVRVPQPPAPLEVLPKIRKVQSRITTFKYPRTKIQKAQTTKKLSSLETRHLPNLRKSYLHKPKR